MTIGIVAEGVTDLMVIRNILYAHNIEKNQIRFLRPSLSEDATDRNDKPHSGNLQMDASEFGSWTLVIKECVKHQNIDIFFSNILEDEKLLIIQIDSDECTRYDVVEVIPINSLESIEEQRSRIIAKLNDLLDTPYSDHVIHAVCIRNMEAWILAMENYNPRRNETSYYSDPKSRLRETGDNKLRLRSQKEAYDIVSSPFRKQKVLNRAIKNNYSLKLFCDDLIRYIHP